MYEEIITVKACHQASRMSRTKNDDTTARGAGVDAAVLNEGMERRSQLKMEAMLPMRLCSTVTQ